MEVQAVQNMGAGGLVLCKSYGIGFIRRGIDGILFVRFMI